MGDFIIMAAAAPPDVVAWAVATSFPNHNFRLSVGCWLVSAEGSAGDIATALGLPVEAAFVFFTTNFCVGAATLDRLTLEPWFAANIEPQVSPQRPGIRLVVDNAADGAGPAGSGTQVQ